MWTWRRTHCYAEWKFPGYKGRTESHNGGKIMFSCFCHEHFPFKNSIKGNRDEHIRIHLGMPRPDHLETNCRNSRYQYPAGDSLFWFLVIINNWKNMKHHFQWSDGRNYHFNCRGPSYNSLQWIMSLIKFLYNKLDYQGTSQFYFTFLVICYNKWHFW